MKFVVLHGYGLATGPLSELDGRSPLQVATKPHLDRIAMEGELGSVLVPGGQAEAGSDMTQLALLGYDPRKYHAGRGAFEATGLGVVLGEHDVAYQCTMVTLRGQAPGAGAAGGDIKRLGPHAFMEDAEAGGIETEEARELIDSVNEQLGSETLQFYPGSRSRHVMVWVDGKVRAVCTDPAKVVGRAIGEFLPTGDGADFLKQVMDAALIILREHPVNEERRQAGKKPANCLWLWGQGRTPMMPKLTDRFQVSGVIVSESDLHRGIGLCAGLEAVPPERLGGGALVDAMLRELEKKDFAYVYVGHRPEGVSEKDGKAIVQEIEGFDRTVVGPLLEGLDRTGPFRLLVLCEPVSGAGLPTQVKAAPYAILGSGGRAAGTRRFTEADAEAAKTVVRDPTRLLPKLFAQGKGGTPWH
jgi:2,3-bisphosphoglycerate-independent phosphoglycerate mutase